MNTEIKKGIDTMETIKNFTNIVEGACRVKELFGVNPFTSKQYNEGRKPGSAVIDTLVVNHIVKVVKTEEFEKEVPSYWGKEYMVNKDGKIVMEEHEYDMLPTSMQVALVKANNGYQLEKVHRDTEIIKCKRYYYALDLNGYEQYMNYRRMEYGTALVKKTAEIEKLTKEVIAIKTILG